MCRHEQRQERIGVTVNQCSNLFDQEIGGAIEGLGMKHPACGVQTQGVGEV